MRSPALFLPQTQRSGSPTMRLVLRTKRAGLFEDLTSPILTSPAKTFDWTLGNTATRAFAGEAGGRQVVVFVAKEGPYQGKVLSAVVPDAGQITQWGL